MFILIFFLPMLNHYVYLYCKFDSNFFAVVVQIMNYRNEQNKKTLRKQKKKRFH